MTPEEAEKVNDLKSADLVKIQEAAYWLVAQRAYHLLETLKEIRKTMPPLVALRDYRWNVDRCILELENFQSGAKCHCNLYHHGMHFSISGETSAGYIKIQNSVVKQDEYLTEYSAVCCHCDRKWQVTERVDYHYPTYNWQEI